jgi:RNA polymerase sigma factor (sigma-70 family)
MDDPQGGWPVVKIQGGAVLKPLRVLLNVGLMAGLSDQELLERFMDADREVAELAFAAIVDRHGPMVLRVCGRALCNSHDAQDAFQATFFVLALKAHSVRRRMSVASWLHGVAYRVCLRARTADARRRRRERTAATRSRTLAADGEKTGDSAEMGDLIHQELDRLPERFRAPIVLCDLEGIAYEEAARMLGCPVGTVKSRLARGRERLRLLLVRRGLGPSVRVVMLPAARTAVPAILRDATAHAAIRFTMNGPPAIGTISKATAALTEGMLKSMTLFRLKLTTVVLVVSGLGTTAAVGVIAGSIPAAHPQVATRESALKPPDPSPTQARRDGFPERPLAEMPRLTRVEFRGRKAVRLKDIEDLTGLKAGNRADPAHFRAAVSRIPGFYVEKGYDLASVTLIEGGNPADTQVVIEIFEGPKVKVKNISFTGNQFATGAQLRVKIATRKAIPEQPGRYHSDMLDDSRQKLIEYYQSQGFFEAKAIPMSRPGAHEGEIDLTFAISEGTRYRVRKVIIEGNTEIKTEELREDLELRSGKPYVKSFNEADKNRMLIKYGELGFIDAQIVCEPRFTNELGVVDLVYKVEENGPSFFSESTVRANHSSKKPPAPIISAIHFVGDETIPSAYTFDRIATRAGQPLDRNWIQADVGNLLKTLQFSDVKAHCQEKQPGSGQYVVTFYVREMPQIIPRIEYRGRKSIPLKEIEYNTDVKEGRPADRVRTALAINQIKRLYLQKGFTLATVTPLVEGYPGDIKAVIEIFEGPDPRLRSIAFEGNHLATDSQLTMMLTRKSIVPKPGTNVSNWLAKVVEERQRPIPYDLIDEDKRKMTDYYRSQGFYDCQIQSYFDGANPADLRLTYHVDEGYCYKLRNVSFVGNKRLSNEAIRHGLPLESGRPLLPAMIEEAKNVIVDKYRAIGYKNARVVSAKFSGVIAVDPPDKADLIFEIDEATP